MSGAIAYGTFVKYGMNIYRSATYLQWGNSENLIGACVLSNPGIAVLEARGLYIHGPINEGREFAGVIKPDDAAAQIINLVERLYEGEKLEGTLYIYYLYSMLDAPCSVFNSEVIDEKINQGILFKGYEDFVAFSDMFPWVLLAWGCDNRPAIYLQKERWKNYITKNNVPHIGIDALEYPGYLHPRQQGNWRKDKYLGDLVSQFRAKNLSLKAKERTVSYKEIVSNASARDRKKMKTTDKLFGFIHERKTEKKTLSPETLMKDNITLIEDKQYSKVLENCDKAMKLNDKYLPIYIQRSQALEAMRDSTAAVKNLGQLLVRTKDVSLYDIYDAKISEYRGDNEKALTCFNSAVQVVENSKNENINNPEVLIYINNSIGKLLNKMKRHEEAIVYFDKSLAIRYNNEAEKGKRKFTTEDTELT